MQENEAVEEANVAYFEGILSKINLPPGRRGKKTDPKAIFNSRTLYRSIENISIANATSKFFARRANET
jgi:hypothetical protein